MRGPHTAKPGGQPGVGRDRRLGAFEQIQVLVAADGVSREPQVKGQG
jgi:hypothetical protein